MVSLGVVEVNLSSSLSTKDQPLLAVTAITPRRPSAAPAPIATGMICGWQR